MIKELVLNIIVALLALSSLLINFLKFNHYSLLAPESLIFFGGIFAFSFFLGLLAQFGGKFVKFGVYSLLLTLLVDYQFPDFIQSGGAASTVGHLVSVFGGLFILAWVLHRAISQVMVSVFATIIFITFIVPIEAPQSEISTALKEPANTKLPPIIHIILDEHIGIEGIPTAVKGGQVTKDLLKNFYLSQGFALFGKAFSAHDATRLSLGSMVALGTAPGGENVQSTNLKRGTWGTAYTIQENPYFQFLRKSGYKLNIYQNDFLDFCGSSSELIARCVTAPCCSIGILAKLPMTAIRKTRIQASTFLELFVTYKVIRKVYRFLDHIGMPIPYWDWERQFATISGYNTLNRLKSDMSDVGKGQFYFTHALIPHSPYVYDRKCNVNAPDLWLTRYSEQAIEIDRWRDEKKNIKNTSESRAERYSLFFEQALCTQQFLGEIFGRLKAKGLFDDVIIIVHGDHGARLPIIGPSNSNNVPLSAEDVIDSYSTLFAIKAPGITPGYDTRLLSIQALMENIVKGDSWRLSNDGLVEKMSSETRLKDSSGPGRKMVNFGKKLDLKSKIPD
jgi:hypothetical protein